MEFYERDEQIALDDYLAEITDYAAFVKVSGRNTGNNSIAHMRMVELAKQRYRDLLSEVPDHWPARYNLARALQLAPEGAERNDDERIDPVKSVNVIVPGFEKKDLP